MSNDHKAQDGNAQHTPADLTDAARDVLAERQRQIGVERCHYEHDDEHEGGSLARAAGSYALMAGGEWPTLAHRVTPPVCWPWEPRWWKPTTPRRMLVKAGALILAEIERLDRAAKATGATS